MSELRCQTSRVRIGRRPFDIQSDDDYLRHIGNDFEPHMCALFDGLIRPDFNCLDIGANIGCTSILFGQLAARVTAFEPSPSTFQILQRNVAASALTNIELRNVGLGAKAERLTLTFAPNNRSGAFVSNLTQASSGHTIENIDIAIGDESVGPERIDFIKLDVEGFEMQVLTGLTGVIARDRPVLVTEMNHWCLNAFQRTSIPDFLDYLLGLFPILYAFHGSAYLDLRDESQRYIAMYRHILHLEYSNLVGAFDEAQVARILKTDAENPLRVLDPAPAPTPNSPAEPDHPVVDA